MRIKNLLEGFHVAHRFKDNTDESDPEMDKNREK